MEDRVIDLYYNQKKTYREIEKLVRKSPRDIRTILNKVEPPEHSMSVSSRAYKLFSEHKSPIEVAIALNIRQPEAVQFYKEYFNLQDLDTNILYTGLCFSVDLTNIFLRISLVLHFLYVTPAIMLETNFLAIKPSKSIQGLKIVIVIPTARLDPNKILNRSLSSEKLKPPSRR